MSKLAYCSSDERAAYVFNCISQGEKLLLKGDEAGLKLFDQAAALDGCNPELFYRQGLALFEYGSQEGKEHALLLANKKFKQASLLCPDYFEAWHAWGNALCLLGTIHEEHHYFLQAEERLKKAVDLSAGRKNEELAELFWDYGVVCSRIAEQSEEAIDLQAAHSAFQKASQYQEALPEEFWNEYGSTCLKMAEKINDIRLNVKAIHCLKHAVSLSISSYQGWMLLAQAFEKLYAQTHDEDHFTQANHCFTAASHLKPQETEMWLKWARLLCDSGERTSDLKKLRASLEKCQRSHACDSKQPLVLALWAQALARIGAATDRLDLLVDAENKISEALRLLEDEEDPEVWLAYGLCLNSFARYFEDLDYCDQAIEKFQHGLSLDRTSHQLWHALAKTHASIGEIDSNIDAYEKALLFHVKALNIYPCSTYTFDYALSLSDLGDLKRDQKILEDALIQFEHALSIQKNALYLHPEWLFHYAYTLNLLGDFQEDEAYYVKSIEILSHVLMIDPDFPGIHHRLGLSYTLLGDLVGETDHFHRAIHHFRLASRQNQENDRLILDWGVTLINLAEHSHDSQERELFYQEAEHKITEAAKLGNQEAFYQLACLYSLLNQVEKAMHFIEKAHNSKALPPLDDVLEDDWLEPLRSTSMFQEFLSHLEKSS